MNQGADTSKREGSFEREFHGERFQDELNALRRTIASQEADLQRIAAIATEPAVLVIAKRYGRKSAGEAL